MIAQAVIHLGRSSLLLSQFVHRYVRQIALAIQFAVVGQHQAIAENVVRGGEKAASGFGKTMNPVAERFGQEADIAVGVSGLFFVWAVCSAEPRNLGVAGPESGFYHS